MRACVAASWTRWRPALPERNARCFSTRVRWSEVGSVAARSAVLVIDSGIARTFAGSGYNRRRAECEEAAKRLGVAALRDVSDMSVAGILPEPLRRRVRHVVSENTRVLRAADCRCRKEFGTLMNASHASLRDDYEVSTPELDRLVALLQAHPECIRRTVDGRRFWGCVRGPCQDDSLLPVATGVLEEYAVSGFKGRMLVPLNRRRSGTVAMITRPGMHAPEHSMRAMVLDAPGQAVRMRTLPCPQPTAGQFLVKVV